VPNDTNNDTDIFVHDRVSGTTEIVSVASDGITYGNAGSSLANISADGRYVTFASLSDNLVSGDTNSMQDVFVHDRQTGSTQRVSISSAGDQSNGYSDKSSISGDGNYVVFDSFGTNLVTGDTNKTWDVFVRDRLNGLTERVSVNRYGGQGNYASQYPVITQDGRYVAFESYATNLVRGDTNGKGDIFVHDRLLGLTERVSLAYNGAEGNKSSYSTSISNDGHHVAFVSDANNLVNGDINNKADIFVNVTYSISGTVKDSYDAPLQGVVITDGNGHFTTTAADGTYLFNLMAGGEYLLTPSRAGYTFAPETISLTLSADAVDQNFTGTPGAIYWSVFLPIVQR
jgi:hypothetical protein